MRRLSLGLAFLALATPVEAQTNSTDTDSSMERALGRFQLFNRCRPVERRGPRSCQRAIERASNRSGDLPRRTRRLSFGSILLRLCGVVYADYFGTLAARSRGRWI